MNDRAEPMIQNTEAFEQLLESHRGILFKVANTYCWQPDDRADLLQEMATQLWRAWPDFDPTRTFSTWMYRIALNVAISYLRNQSPHRRNLVSMSEEHHLVADPQTAEQTSEMTHHRLLLHNFIERQTALDKALLLLYLEEHSQREIADILGITESNVSTKICRLKQRLHDEL